MTLHVHEWGAREAPAVVCLHGIGGHGLRFRRLAEQRLARRFHVLAPDLRGCGRSTWEPPWTFAQHLDDLRGLAAARGIERCAWIGHSFGGRLVLELAAGSPELVAHGILLDPAIWVPPPIALDRIEQTLAQPSFATFDGAVARAREYAPGAPPDVVEQDAREHVVRGLDGLFRYRRSTGAIVAGFSELAEHPPLDRLTSRLLVVRGAASDVVPEPLVDALTADFPDVFQFVTVPGGHNVLWEAFDETAEAVEASLR